MHTDEISGLIATAIRYLAFIGGSIRSSFAYTPPMVKATELTKDMFIRWEGQLQMVLETEHVKPGKGPAYVQAKLKNMETGTIKFNRINSSDKVEDVEIERRNMMYSYDASGRGSGPFV